MTTKTINFTKEELAALQPPKAGRDTYHDGGGPQSVRGLQLRVTAAGAKTFSYYARVHGGQSERVTLGKFPRLSVEKARDGAKLAAAEYAAGRSRNKEKREAKAAAAAQAIVAKESGITLKQALESYVEGKRRGKQRLPLKQRTKDDYLEMVDAGNERRQPGELHPLADKPLAEITGDEIRSLYLEIEKRGKRRAAYAGQVLRAVLNWNGTKIDGSPFDKGTPEKDRIVIPQAEGIDEDDIDDTPGAVVRPEDIGKLWKALTTTESAAADYLALTLLCGTRPAELLTVPVGNFDAKAHRLLLRDTKNRRDHRIYLSRQALVIVKRYVRGKKPEDHLFPFDDPPQRDITDLVKKTGIKFSAKTLRATFASIAVALVTYPVLKKLMNHRVRKDVTITHYIKLDEATLRAGWQAVADRIEAETGAK